MVHLKLKDVQYALMLAKTKNFRAAAEACFISQPGLSNQIKQLETYLGVLLFERSKKSVKVLPVMHKIIPVMEDIVRQSQCVKEIAQHYKNPLSTPFRLGAIPTLAMYVFPSVVNCVHEHWKDMNLVLIEEKTDDLLEYFQHGKIDAALMAMPIEHPKLVCEPIFEDAFYLAVCKEHPLLKKPRVYLEDLKPYTLYLLSEGHCLREQALEICARIGTMDTKFSATSLETIRQMVRLGGGVTLMPKIAMRSEEDIFYVKIHDVTSTRNIALVWRCNDARYALIKEFATALKRALVV